jgi:hypothetical protein
MWDVINLRIVEHDYTAGGGWEAFSYWFNLLEGVVWFGIGGYVFNRFLKNRKSHLEIVYAMLFCVFGLTDFREIYDLPVWLFAAKAVIFGAIILVRIRLWPYYNRLTI